MMFGIYEYGYARWLTPNVISLVTDRAQSQHKSSGVTQMGRNTN